MKPDKPLAIWRVATTSRMRRYANGTFPEWQATITRNGRVVAHYCDPVRQRAEWTAQRSLADRQEHGNRPQ